MNRLLLVLAALALAAPAHAEWPPGRFGYSRYAAFKANPSLGTRLARETRDFVKVLRPQETTTISYDAAKQYRSLTEWSYDRQRRRPIELSGRPERRGVWFSWDMLGVPPQADVRRAILRVYPPRAFYDQADRQMPKVYLSESSWGAEMDFWTDNHVVSPNGVVTVDGEKRRKRRAPPQRGLHGYTPDPPGTRPVINGPVFEWDITDLLRRHHADRDDPHGVFQLVVRNMDFPTRPAPRIAVTYTLGAEADLIPRPEL